MGYIYRIYCKLSEEKCYIGQTTNYKRRWKDHINNIKDHNTPLYNAMNKYGVNNFVFELLLECNNDHMNIYEKRYIELYNTYPPPNGYNLTSGGDSNYRLTEESRNKISIKAKELLGNPEFKNRRDKQLAEAHRTPESRKKASSSQLSFLESEEGKKEIERRMDSYWKWRETPEGKEQYRANMIKLQQSNLERKQNTPIRHCDVCGYSPKQNSKSHFLRHFSRKPHLKALENISAERMAENNC